MPTAELFLGAFLQVLFDRLASPELLNFARRKGVDTLLKKWENMLISIKLVLDDAEDKQLRGDLRVKSWLEDLRNLAYDIEDLLDEFAIENAENKSEEEPRTSKVRSLLPSCCFKLSPRELMVDHEMRSKIGEMDVRLKYIITHKDTLNLRENHEEQAACPRVEKPLLTTHLPEPYFVSRDVEKREILELLTREDQTCADVKVIPIVGMGGLGKTALAQQVYNDARVMDYFDVRAWTCVSDDFDVHAITKKILETTNGNLPCEGKDLDWLHGKLKEHLAGKKFLIVLDDVWNENYGNWTILLRPFQSGAKGSKIIVTTRNFRVAEIARAQPYILKLLSQDECMTLLAFHALGVGNFDHNRNLEDLGFKIVEKCQGLPLAVKTLAGLLRSKASPHEWEAMLKSEIWDLPQGPNDVLPALKLSYLHLPSNLKRCFAYCAIFPKDYEIERDELIHWWIADGLLVKKKGQACWHDGLKIFNELLSRSLFEKSSSSISGFVMHDLVNDLAKLVAGATCFSSGEPESEGDQNDTFLARHASFIPSQYIVCKRVKIYHGMKRLRSFISLEKRSRYYERSILSEKVLCDLLLRLRYLRVLSFTRYNINKVPNCIGKMRHLRHLNLSYTYIETLPKSIVGLYNLEALMLRGCEHLVELPKDMEKLINLRFLDIVDTSSLRAMPLHVGNLVGLEMLTKFVVGTENGLRLNELKNLKNLRGELCISDLHKVQEAGDATNADLCTKEGISRLTMEWCDNFENYRDEELEKDVLESLRPPPIVENLVISYYGGLEFPSWLGNPSPVNIVHLRLHGCLRAKTVPPLGQLSSLKKLCIEDLNAICKIGYEFYGTKNPFPLLITLEFRNMPVWEDWSHCASDGEEVVFPRLERLLIQDCPMLIGRLPSQLSSLIRLEIKSCPRMDASPSIISLPSLKKLDFGNCNEGMLKSLVNLTSLIGLDIRDIAELTCLNHELTSSLIKLEKLEMDSCNELLYLWQDMDVIRNLAHLKKLVVKKCPELISFAAGEGDVELPGNLETMKLRDCINLEKLPSEMHALSSLGDLSVENCPKLVSFPETGLPRSVTSLSIRHCEMLQFLPIGSRTYRNEPSSSSHSHDGTSSCLQELRISNCGSLGTSPFSEGRFPPATLKRLEIRGCKGVESLAEINGDRLQSLQEIEIGDCKNLRSLPEGLHTLTNLTSLRLERCPALELECLPPFPPSITSIRLEECPKIKSLPNQLHRLTCLHDLIITGCESIALPNQLHRLTCLRDLKIRRCESITRFPNGGLPRQLRELTLWRCGNMKQPVREWLTPLTSLEFLWIDGSTGGVGEGVDLVLPLPPSLLHLYIYDMGKVERVATSLPPSLRSLSFSNCPKLRELPQDGLPPSLEQFWIMSGCPVLKERCTKGTGYYWPLLREIPRVDL